MPSSTLRSHARRSIRQVALVSVAALLSLLGTLASPPALAQGLALDSVEVADQLVFPLGIIDAGDGSGRLFLVQQTGEILVWNGVSVEATPFLDLSDSGLDRVICCGERGLLGLVFHPDYATNGELYVNYTRDSDGQLQTVLSRFQVSDMDPDLADPASEEILLVFDQRQNNHNGGNLHFGPDGYLYISTGDGGGGGDPGENAQNLGNLLGNILRIDVDSTPDPGLDYAIPPDNPFVGDPAARDEIWAYGLRNPWRFSFDRGTGDLWIGDVGQGTWEEIDLQPAASPGGENYGWDCRAGLHDYNDTNGDLNANCTGTGYTDPILEYAQVGGRCSVTGGFRYRGSMFPRLSGVYLYADFCTGEILGTVPRCDGAWESRVVYDTPFLISTFGEDSAGEIYITERAGTQTPDSKVHRLILAAGSDGPDLLPSPTTLDFGSVEVGDTVTLPFTLGNANPGPEALAVASRTLSDTVRFTLDPFAGADPCRLGGRPCLVPGDGCTQSVTFQATATGSVSESLTFEGNFLPEAITLTANVVPCASDVDFDLTSTTVTGSETHRACDTLTAGPDVTVANGGDLTLQAGTRIVIRDGFSIATGGRLVLEIF